MNLKETEALIAEKIEAIEALNREIESVKTNFLNENKPFAVGTLFEFNSIRYRVAGYSYDYSPRMMVNPMKKDGTPSRRMQYFYGVSWNELKDKLKVVGFYEI